MMSYLQALLLLISELTVEMISSWGYWGIALGMAVESANIPLPSEIILPFGGFLASTGRVTLWGAIWAGTFGGTLGSLLGYWMGLRGGRPLVTRYGRWLRLNLRDLQRAEDWFQKYGQQVVFYSRLLPVVRTFISFPAGLVRMNLAKFIIYTFLGSLIWSTVLTYIGYKLGLHWDILRPLFHKLDFLLVVILVSGIGYLLLRKKGFSFNKFTR